MTSSAPIPPAKVARFTAALPFGLSFVLIPLVWIGAIYGGFWVLLAPLCAWYLFTAIDVAVGLNTGDADLNTTEDQLFWYKLLTQIWVPLQFVALFGLLFYVSRAGHLNGWEKFGVMFGTGVMTGTVGIVFSHELLHQRNRFERALGDLLLAMVLYSHFRSEHLLVHHRYVGTPRDPVTARYNEGFHRFYPRVLRECWHSAFKAEAEMLGRKGLPWYSRRNPFWLYWGLQLGMLVLALVVGGWEGVLLFVVQAGVAIWQLEVVNYVEHYGLTRKHLGNGKYEHVMPRHSWNAAHKATNWLMINLQRHSDHHYKPDRRFPLLQNYSEDEAPQLPYGYPLMAMAAMIPPVWRRIMNPKVRHWRQMYYPEITDWSAYNKARNPLPR
ncbi:alkane 1-monooxygenase [Tropicibacter naphthalenivorans]|uniref:Alkane 1-monooxygenase 2 n=1 Tax=Tropicibacter naphthalenivorans TaxID=441103 RepID=A0A0P1GV85_9RHOB|nr:alkane 1-monooxygenase [Tropicibacter naphthalenivorans]CUH78455.1 Alkane 1-monooxygenase 2 [Tropicibacter naphthalenivorans]SMC80547.1 alkane 1-monooxygenase [Tropicibacter naphthalenivorans]